MSASYLGTVQSHTVIRVSDKAHAAMAPFTLLLVALEDGNRVLGHFHGAGVPEIGSRVTGSAASDETIIFRALEEML
jgi:uncharacterized OB-fold protein